MKHKTRSLIATTIIIFSPAAYAQTITVGGVVWDPNSIFGNGNLPDFSANASLLETTSNGTIGDTVEGWGKINRFNSVSSNSASFCPNCELTYYYTMDLASVTSTGTTSTESKFDNFQISFYVDSAQNYTGAVSTAQEGTLFLSAQNNGYLTRIAKYIGTGSDTLGSRVNLDVTGGLAFANFNTNSKDFDSDLAFTLSSLPTGQSGLFFGTSDLTGDTIAVPEPSSAAILSLGGLALIIRRKR